MTENYNAEQLNNTDKSLLVTMILSQQILRKGQNARIDRIHGS